MRSIHTAWLAVVLLTVAAGCDSAAEDPATGTDPAPSSAVQTDDVPAVDNPLAIDGFTDRPCDILTTDQLATVGVTTKGVPNGDDIQSQLAPYCTWPLGDGDDTLEVSLPEMYATGLDEDYELRDNLYDYFDPTTIDGYPAVFAGMTDLRDNGACDLVVGIADDQTIDVTVSAISAGHADACGLASDVATEVITTLRNA